MRSVIITIFAIAGLILASDANTSVVNNKVESNSSKINVDNIKLEFEEIKSYSDLPPRTRGKKGKIYGYHAYTTLLLKTDKKTGKSTLFGLLNEDLENMGASTLLPYIDKRLDMSVQYVIQPIKNKKFYIFFSNKQTWNKRKVIIYNASTDYKVDLKGYLVSVKDYDNDKIPELVTSYKDSNRAVVALYKIINPDTEPTVTLLSENKLQVKGYPPEIEIRDKRRTPELVYGPKFKYYPEDGFLLVDQDNPYEKKSYDSRSDSGLLSDAYRKFNKFFNENSKFAYKTSKTATRSVATGTSVINTENWSNLEKAKLDRMDLRRCTTFSGRADYMPSVYLCSPQKNKSSSNKPLKIKSFKASDGTLVISDSNMYNDYIINATKKKINGNTISAIAKDNLLILSNMQTKRSMYYTWEQLLDYRPKYVKYFDFKYLVTVKKENDKEYLKIYKANLNTSNTTQELW